MRGKCLSGDLPCVGSRPDRNNDFQWLTYNKVHSLAHCLASAITNRLGVSAGNDHVLAIYANNSVEWIIADLSIQMNRQVSVPLYDTLGPGAANTILIQTACKVVFCGTNFLAQKILKLADQVTTFHSVVLFEEITNETMTMLCELAPDRRIEYIYDLIENCGDLIEIDPPKPTDLFTICYTSGTTAIPKGVPLTQEMVFSFACGVGWHVLQGATNFGPDDVYLSYLPLAHMLERGIEQLIFLHGGRVGYFSGDVKFLMDDIVALRPTVLTTVPRVLNRLYDRTMQRVNSNALSTYLFKWAIKSKIDELRQGIIRRDSIWDWLFFNKFRKALGGNIRVVATGSAPISPHILNFARAAFSCSVFEGYGQTECTAGVTLTLPMEFEAGHVGPPIPCCEIKLINVPEMELDWRRDGRGEVCVRGPCNFQGYFKDEEKTKQVLDEGRWVHTGDIGMWTATGCLKIVDRCKHIFKLSQGEYLAPEKIEQVLLQCPAISQIFLDGNSHCNYCVAIVVPDFEALRPEMTLTECAKIEMCEDRGGALRETILKEFDTVGRSNGLKGFEIPKYVHLHRDPFTLEDGHLTPTLKTMRSVLRKLFHNELIALYREHPN